MRSTTSFNPTRSPINPPISTIYPNTALHISSTTSVSHPPGTATAPADPEFPALPAVVFSGLSAAFAMACRNVMRRVEGVGAGEWERRRRRSSIWVVCFSVRVLAVESSEVVWWWIKFGRGCVGSSREISTLSSALNKRPNREGNN